MTANSAISAANDDAVGEAGGSLRDAAAGEQMRFVLVIDPDPETARFLKLCGRRGWPELITVPYDPARGVPDRQFDWSEYDAVVMETDLARRGDTGLDWLRELAATPGVPPIVMLTSLSRGTVAEEAARHGAVATLDRNSLGPRPLVAALIQCARHNDTVQRGRVSEARAQDTPPDVPGYTVERELAPGNMARVYVASSAPGEPLVVVKVLQLGDAQNSELLQRFMQEYQLLMRLKHPNVIRFYERGFASDFAYIVMDYCAFGDLKSRLATPLGLTIALNYLSQIARGLAAAHRVGVVHRDLKPANVLFRTQHDLVLTDFGVAKDLGRSVALTLTKSIIGTLYYVSPEQIMRDTCTPVSDLYSLGAVLHQMLTGSPPYRGKTAAGIMDAHCSAPIPRLEGEGRCAQPLLDGLLAKDPEDRFQNVDDLLAGIGWVAGKAGLKIK